MTWPIQLKQNDGSLVPACVWATSIGDMAWMSLIICSGITSCPLHVCFTQRYGRAKGLPPHASVVRDKGIGLSLKAEIILFLYNNFGLWECVHALLVKALSKSYVRDIYSGFPCLVSRSVMDPKHVFREAVVVAVSSCYRGDIVWLG